VLLGLADNWAAPFALLFAVLALSVVTGWFAARDRYVEDELPDVRPEQAQVGGA
jgi:cyanate permease